MNWRGNLPERVKLIVDQCAQDPSEWLGAPGEAGARDYIVSLIRAVEKNGFEAGYLSGAISTFEALPHDDSVAFSIDDNRIGAERRYLKWEGTGTVIK